MGSIVQNKFSGLDYICFSLNPHSEKFIFPVSMYVNHVLVYNIFQGKEFFLMLEFLILPKNLMYGRGWTLKVIDVLLECEYCISYLLLYHFILWLLKCLCPLNLWCFVGMLLLVLAQMACFCFVVKEMLLAQYVDSTA